MTAEKHWLSKNCEDLCTETSTSNDLDISWSSSSPEKEHRTPRKSNSQADQQKPLNQWIRTATAENLVAISQVTYKPVQFENVCNQPTTSTIHSFEESPIIGRLRLDLSPVTAGSQINYKPKRIVRDFDVEQSSCSAEKESIIPKKFKGNVDKHISPICDQHSASVNHSFEESSITDRFGFDLSPVIGKNRINHTPKRTVNDFAIDQSSFSFEKDCITPKTLKSNTHDHINLVCAQHSTSINQIFEESPTTDRFQFDLSPVIGKNKLNHTPKTTLKDFNVEPRSLTLKKYCTTPKKVESKVHEQTEPIFNRLSSSYTHSFKESPIIDRIQFDLSSVIHKSQTYKAKRTIKDFDVQQRSSSLNKDCTTLKKFKRNTNRHIEPICYQPSPSSITNFEESPIIGKFRYDLSPVISKNQINCKAKRIVGDFKLEDQEPASQQLRMIVENCTPVINKISRNESQGIIGQQPVSTCSTQQSKNLIGKTRIDFQTKMIIDSDPEECNSRSRYSTQQSNTIETDSPTSSQKTRIVILSQQSCYEPTQYSIHPVSSQEGSEVILSTESITTVSNSSDSPKTSKGTLITESTETSSSKSSGCEPLYHEISPRRKKRYKKDGLADQLQKARHQQKIDCAIWRHEMYLKKSNCWSPGKCIDKDNSVLLLKINKFWEEFGVTIVECDRIGEQNDASSKTAVDNENVDAVIKKNKASDNNVDLNKCLVIIGFNVTHDVRIKINAKLKLCMPYMTKVVKYNELYTFCHFNVSKLLSFK